MMAGICLMRPRHPEYISESDGGVQPAYNEPFMGVVELDD